MPNIWIYQNMYCDIEKQDGRNSICGRSILRDQVVVFIFVYVLNSKQLQLKPCVYSNFTHHAEIQGLRRKADDTIQPEYD